MTGFGLALLATIAWGALSFGAVYPWAYWPVAAASALLGAWSIIATKAWRDARTINLGLAAAAVAAAIGMQALPLPYSILEQLSPGVDRFLRQYQLLYHPASLHSLSIDTASTLTALALFVAMSLLGVGLVRAVRIVGVEWLVIQVMGFGVALAVVGVVQKAFVGNATDFLVYGFWAPTQRGNPFGPFINRNHFAGWMVMALPLVVGYFCGVIARFGPAPTTNWRGWVSWAATEEAGRPMLLAFAALVMGMALTLSGSRSGLAAFSVAMAVIGGFVMVYTRAKRARVAAAVCLLFLLLGGVAWAGIEATIERFGATLDDPGGRVSAWRDTIRIISDFPGFGVGVGSYPRAMLMYQTGSRISMYAHAHNEYLQMAAEGGMLVVVPILVLVALVVQGIRRRLTSGEDNTLTWWIRAGAVAGLAGIATQSLVEFSLQMPGNRVLFVVLLATALHRPSRPKTPHVSSSPSASVQHS
jgi:O-antigen ligase